MITISITKVLGERRRTIHFHNFTKLSEIAYAFGFSKPHHPLPAIIYHTYLPTEEVPRVMIYEHSRFECEPYRKTYNRLVYLHNCI